MAKVLHILNGDSAATIFSKTTLQGDVLVLREMFCEGPLATKVASDEFWKKRYAFYESEFNVNKLDYFDNTIKEVVRLEDVYAYDEIVLWFDHNLHSQVNLMAICSLLLAHFVKKINYYLVSVGKEKGRKTLQILSDFSPNDFLDLYENKIKITKHDFTFVTECWHVFVSNNKKEIAAFNFGRSHKFKYFYKAMQQQLKRYPLENGLNEIENKIRTLQNQGIKDEKALLQTLLIWQQQETVYGFNNLQYKMYIKKLKTNKN